MAKRIVLCFDGTWNTPATGTGRLSRLFDNFAKMHGGGADALRQQIETVDPTAGVETNVCRLYRSVVRREGGAVPPGEMGQVKWYDAGVGTNWYDRLPGGVFGVGLSQNIRDGYKFLSDTYDPGDHVFVLGFSRGAYTARSLVGMIRNCGLLPKGLAGLNANSPQMMDAYNLYRHRGDDPDSPGARAFRARTGAAVIKVKFLGVWDTVGALGIPIEAFNDFNRAEFEFHDTELSGIVENAFHAVAVDEHREPYRVTLWVPKEKPNQVIEQRWFAGAHADVGGGYPSRALSDITLKWMQDKASGCGLLLDPHGIPAVTDANPTGELHDSYIQFLNGAYAVLHPRYLRPVGGVAFANEVVDRSVASRASQLDTYRPGNNGLAEALRAMAAGG